MENIISCSEAKAAGLRHYFTGKPCGRGHIEKRFVSTRKCIACCQVESADWRSNNSDYFKKRYEENKDQILSRQAEYSSNHPDRRRASRKGWAAKNNGRVNAFTASHRAAKLNATPAWADLEQMRAFYLEAERLTRETGIEHHVDHIFPLQGKTSCGLHVQTNLQVSPYRENIQKGNNLPVYFVKDGELVVLTSF